jgi:hypothetical protein
MKNLKKNFFTICLIFSLSLGVGFSFIPVDATAQELEVGGEIGGGNRCYTKLTDDSSVNSMACTGSSGECAWAAGDGSKKASCPN